MIHIVFFILLLFCILLFLYLKPNVLLEGLETPSSCSDNTLYISKITASDIQVLNKQIDELQSIDTQINKIDIETKKNEEDIVKVRMISEKMKADATKKFEKTKK